MPYPKGNPYWLADGQPWAVDHLTRSHNDALYRIGEYVIFFLLWQPEDFTHGLVERCSECFIPFGEQAEVFQQPSRANCPTCLGTTFEGGWRARIIRPIILDFTEEQDVTGQRGQYQTSTASIETTNDFRGRVGDFFVRADGTRWTMKEVRSEYIESGFQASTPQRSVHGFSYPNCAFEEHTSPIYLADPRDPAELVTLLDKRHWHYPPDFSSFDIARADLIDRLPLPATPSVPVGPLTWGQATAYSWSDVSTTSWGDI
jgi:hypothetical protein